jgi:hypothetical protein
MRVLYSRAWIKGVVVAILVVEGNEVSDKIRMKREVAKIRNSHYALAIPAKGGVPFCVGRFENDDAKGSINDVFSTQPSVHVPRGSNRTLSGQLKTGPV